MSRLVMWVSAVLVASMAGSCHPAKILGLMTTISHSHHIFNSALMVELARRGHQVTVFSPDPEKKPVPNHRDIVIEGAYEELHDEYDYGDFAKYSHFEMVGEILKWGVTSCSLTLKSKGAHQLMELTKNETFDLIITEVAMQECVLPFVAKFGNPPVIGISAYSSPPWANELVGNYLNPSYVNTYILPFTNHMTFQQRMFNFILDTYNSFYRKYLYMPKQNEVSRKFFGDSVPPPSEIEKNITFIMVNEHFSFHYPRPHVPAIIGIGGLQAKPPKPLPKDLQSFLDSATEGVVYMGLGTNVRSDQLREKERRAFLDAFSELPQKVLWKWESESLPGQPPNVKIMKWVPQNDVLAHPNVKVFVSHGGMLSTMEAVYHGVPVVGVPFLADQYANLQKNVVRGVAVELDTLHLTKQSVLDAITKILKDPSYGERMKHLSAIYRDRPQTALETAVWWTEYALRHKGAPHLRCASLDLAWYQRWLLDVLAALLLGACAFCAALYWLAWFLVSAFCPRREKLKKN